MSQCPAGLLCWELLHQVALCLGQIKPIDGLGEMQLGIDKPYTRPRLGRPRERRRLNEGTLREGSAPCPHRHLVNSAFLPTCA
jgi:hypothetical protein